MKKSISSLALFLALTSQAIADDYTVQVGAYRSLSNQIIEQAKSHGEIFRRSGRDNLERLSVGRFYSKRDAISLRNTLRVSGFSDAFITNLDSSSASSSAYNYSSDQNHNSYNRKSSTAENVVRNSALDTIKNNDSKYTIDQLNEDERSKATYLDGQLRILSDGNFYTVEQYRQYKN